MSLLMNQIVLNATRFVSEPVIVLPDKTIRFQFSNESYSPTTSSSTSGTSTKGTWTRVSSSPNVWDWYYNNISWTGTSNTNGLFKLNYTFHNTYFSILGANLSGVTNTSYMFSPTTYNGNVYSCDGLISVDNITNSSNVNTMNYMFYNCNSLTDIPLFDTSNVTSTSSMFYSCTSLISSPLFDTSKVNNMHSMFRNCISLTSIPLFNTSSLINMHYAFYNCRNVTTGALALYQQASTQTNPVSYHSYTFKNCGSNTTTGAAELAQIPSGWK